MIDLVRREDGSYTCPEDPGERGTLASRVSVTDDEARLLCWLAYRRSVLELGTGLGVSTRALAEGARRVVTVDPDPWVRENVLKPIEQTYAHVRGIQDAAEIHTLDLGPFDVAFIDGDHRADAVRRDVELAVSMLNLAPLQTSMLILHDVGHPTVLGAAEAALGRKIDVLPTRHGLGIVVFGD